MGMKIHAMCISIILAAIAGLYGQFLWNPLVFDDLPLFMIDEAGHQPVETLSYDPFGLRSLPYATLSWGKALFGNEMWHYRVENLCLHAAVAVALYFFLLRFFETLLPARSAQKLKPEFLAFSAALIFALHPVAVYGAGYLVQRTIVMATLFSLLAMQSYMYGSTRNSSFWLWGSVFFYYLAVFSKEHAVMLPFVLVALTILLHADWREKLKQRWHIGLGYLCIALMVIAIRKGLLGSAYEIYASDMLTESNAQLNLALSALTQCWLFFKYAVLWFFPNPNWMSVDMREPFATSLWSGYLLAFFAFIAWGAAAFRLLLKRGYSGVLGFAMLFPWILFMTEFTAIRIQESFVLYRSYLWAAGACALIPLLLDRLDKRMAGFLVGAVMLAMFPISMDRLASFSHPLLLWDDAAKLVKNNPELPGVFRIYYNRGTNRTKVGDYDGAIDDLTLAAKLQPNWPFSYNNLGAAYGKKGDWVQSAKAFNQAIEVANAQHLGLNPKAFFGRAIAYENLGEFEQARKDYELTCKMVNKGCEKLN